MIPDREETLRAMHIIEGACELNNLSNSAVISALINIVCKTLYDIKVPNEKVACVLGALASCFQSIGASYEIDQELPP